MRLVFFAYRRRRCRPMTGIWCTVSSRASSSSPSLFRRFSRAPQRMSGPSMAWKSSRSNATRRRPSCIPAPLDVALLGRPRADAGPSLPQPPNFGGHRRSLETRCRMSVRRTSGGEPLPADSTVRDLSIFFTRNPVCTFRVPPITNSQPVDPSLATRFRAISSFFKRTITARLTSVSISGRAVSSIRSVRTCMSHRSHRVIFANAISERAAFFRLKRLRPAVVRARSRVRTTLHPSRGRSFASSHDRSAWSRLRD